MDLVLQRANTKYCSNNKFIWGTLTVCNVLHALTVLLAKTEFRLRYRLPQLASCSIELAQLHAVRPFWISAFLSIPFIFDFISSVFLSYLHLTFYVFLLAS